MKINNNQVGLTLIELMIAMAIGLIVTAAVIGLFVSVLSSNNANLNEIRLNQELRAVMSLMTRDIRRAAYNGVSATNSSVNPFSSEAATASDTKLAITGNTVNFSYDADGDGVLDNGEVFGYRLSGTEVQYCQSTGTTFATCVWSALTDSSIVGVTVLSFVENTIVENAGTGAETDVRQITIVLTGQWVNDTNFTRTITETVKLRNEHFDAW